MDDDEDLNDDRKEHQLSGSVKLSTYKTFFKASLSKAYMIFCPILFVAGQIAYSGSDYFLTEW